MAPLPPEFEIARNHLSAPALRYITHDCSAHVTPHRPPLHSSHLLVPQEFLEVSMMLYSS